MKSISIFFESKAGKRIINFIIGVAAAIVMVGALFKLEHYKGASEMLTIGLTTEAFIFLLLGILPPAKEYYWEKIYPNLDVSPSVDSYYKGGSKSSAGAVGGGATQQLDKMFEDANVNPATIEKLGSSFQQLGRSVDQMRDLSDVTTVTSEFSDSAKQASNSLSQMSNTVTGASESMQSFNNAAQDTMRFHEQMQVMNTNLSSLNKIYETELNDANNHLKTMNQFYGTLANATSSMSGAAEDAEKVKNQISQLTDNLTNLNQIYGNMLSAMSGRS